MQDNINHRLGNESLSLDFIRKIRAVSDKTPVLENSKTISQVWNILLRLYNNLKLNVKLSKIESKEISKDLYRKLNTISNWQISVNLVKGILQKLYLTIRFPKYALYTLLMRRKIN
jgi:hypothetical protein